MHLQEGGKALKKDPLRSYRETQVLTATQGKLILMLYDGAVKNINQACEYLKEKHRKYDQISSIILKAQDIVAELMVSLDFENGGEIAKNLFDIYMFMNRQLLEGNIRKDEKILGSVRKMLLELRSAWAQIAEKKNVEGRARATGGVNIAG